MIQCIGKYTYKGIVAFRMHDAGATWFEIYIGRDTHYFNTAQEAQLFIDSMKAED